MPSIGETIREKARALLKRDGEPTEELRVADRTPNPEAGAPPSDAPAAEAVERTYTCECGTEYRVSGEGRHRVYWKSDASRDDPVIDGRCASCERPLPGHHPSETGDDEAGAEREPE